MLVELTVENVAIIERARLELGPGLTVITGETGAGKSLFVDAIELALGSRAETGLVRDGASHAKVALTVDVSSRADVLAACEEIGIEPEDGLLFLQRDVHAGGRSQFRINGKLAPASAAKRLGALLVDLHGQHAHQGLFDPERHRGFLDGWIGAPAERLLAEAADRHAEVQALTQTLAGLRVGRQEREQRIDYLRFQIAEISEASPTPGEQDSLEAELCRLSSVEKLEVGVAEVLDLLQRREGSSRDALTGSLRSLESLATVDHSLAAVIEPLREAAAHLEEGLVALGAYADELQHDPNRMEAVASRIDLLRRLRRKYGATEVDVLAHLESARAELAALEEGSQDEGQIEAALASARERLQATCHTLSELRRQKASEFTERVTAELRDLAMRSAVFQAAVRPRDPGPSGADDVEFTFSANAGEAPKPLARIASGGEISRAMLAIKTALAGRAGVPTLVFDEVEAGLGGHAAHTVGVKLAELAQRHQVIVISHLPQVASHADRHVAIDKVEQSGRTCVRLRELNREERVAEVARMVAGSRVGEAALAHARELIGG